MRCTTAAAWPRIAHGNQEPVGHPIIADSCYGFVSQQAVKFKRQGGINVR